MFCQALIYTYFMFCQAYYHSIYIYTDNLLMLLWMWMYDIYTDNLLMLLWMSMYDIYTDNLLMLLWMSMYDHKCSQHHASFHMYSIFLDKWQALTNTMPATPPPPPPSFLWELDYLFMQLLLQALWRSTNFAVNCLISFFMEMQLQANPQILLLTDLFFFHGNTVSCFHFSRKIHKFGW